MSDAVPDSVVQLQLSRAVAERRRYVLDGVGSLRAQGLGFRTVIAEAGSERWRITRRGVWRPTIHAHDASGAVVGDFEARGLHRGGLRWGLTELSVRPALSGHGRTAVATHDDEELIVIDGRTWGRTPIAVTVVVPSAVDDGMILFA